MASREKYLQSMSACVEADSARIKDQIKSLEHNAARGYDISFLTNTLKALNRRRMERKDVGFELCRFYDEKESVAEEADALQYRISRAVADLKDAEFMGYDISYAIDELAALASRLKVKKELLASLS